MEQHNKKYINNRTTAIVMVNKKDQNEGINLWYRRVLMLLQKIIANNNKSNNNSNNNSNSNSNNNSNSNKSITIYLKHQTLRLLSQVDKEQTKSVRIINQCCRQLGRTINKNCQRLLWKMGQSTQGVERMECVMERGLNYGWMEVSIQGCGGRIRRMGKGSWSMGMGIFMRENG